MKGNEWDYQYEMGALIDTKAVTSQLASSLKPIIDNSLQTFWNNNKDEIYKYTMIGIGAISLGVVVLSISGSSLAVARQFKKRG